MAAGGDNQQTWVPYVPTRDCSMGFCSIYCPQWCYVIFPPPPPSEFSDDGSGGVNFSPLVIAIIGVLAGALLLICYYTVVSKYCGSFRSVHRWLNPSGAAGDSLDLPGGRPRRSEAGWPQDSPANGVDEALIRKIAVHKYRRGDGVVQSSDCSVCLSEFREEESLRLLPKCGHAFHLQCIDTWLRSHSNCPLCRASINIPLHPQPPPQPPPAAATAERVVLEAPGRDEMVIVVEERVEEEEERRELGKNAPPQIAAEQSRHSKLDIMDDDDEEEEEEEEDDRRQIRRSFSTENASNQDKVSIADVLQMGTEDEASSAAAAGTSTSAHGNDDSRNRAPHGAASRSLPSVRFC